MTVPWPVGFFFGNTELSLELWTLISGISEFDDSTPPARVANITSDPNCISE
jgi:hypothetical protein